jgi:hypothetical protein
MRESLGTYLNILIIKAVGHKSLETGPCSLKLIQSCSLHFRHSDTPPPDKRPKNKKTRGASEIALSAVESLR